MPLWLNTLGKTTLGIGICARCQRKFSLDDLMSDPNAPGLKVCKDDMDLLDPYRMPPRTPDRIALRFARPDVDLATHPAGVINDWGDEVGFTITEDGDEYLEMGS